jgi:hypothetical protein
MRVVNMLEAKSSLSRLVEAVESGAETTTGSRATAILSSWSERSSYRPNAGYSALSSSASVPSVGSAT